MNKVDKHAQICKSLNELYSRKNADYGDSFGKSFKEFGLTMSCIRLEYKLNRIKALSKQVSDESITDTLIDLANYAIMTLVEMAQNESEKVPHPKKCDHDRHCLQCDCLCNTCIRDNTHSAYERACCNQHGVGACWVRECPDYVKEE